MPSGIITKGIGGFYYVVSEEGLYECKARGIFRKNEMTPLPGDRVNFSVIDVNHRKGSIEQILERSSLLIRPAVANVDQLIIVVAAQSPDPDLLLLDKLLVTSESKHMKAVICINKTDIDTDNKREEIQKSYSSAGYPIIETNSKTYEGLDELKAVLAGRISSFAGQSGVGKSTLLNIVMDTMKMKTGGLSDKIGRGKHTTRHAELIRLADSGYIVDTPGFSSFELSGMEYKDLQYFYPEFEEYIHKCRFTGCSHVGEIDCAVKQAVENGLVSGGRYERYAELYNLLKQEDSMKYKKK